MNILQFLFLYASILLFSTSSYAQYQTVQSGNWSDPNTWLNGQVPPAWGSPIVSITHAIILNQDYSAGDWELYISSTGSLIQAAGHCYNFGAYGGNAQITNEGILNIGILNHPGEVYNHGQLSVSYINLYGYTQPLFYNTGDVNFYAANLSGNSVLHNYGYFASDPVLSCSGQTFGLNFNGDSLINHAQIDINTAQINVAFFQNNSGASLSTSGALDFNNSTSLQFGTLIAQGDLQVNGGRLSNYGHLESQTRVAVNSVGSLLENFGCDCHTSYSGEIHSPYLHISSVLDNSGRIFIQNDVQAYGRLYSSSCGFLQANNLYSYDRFDGEMVICASLTCYSCNSDGSPVFSCPADNSCNTTLLTQDWVTNFELNNQELQWNFWPDSSCHSLELQSSPNGIDQWSTLSSFLIKEELQTYEDNRQLIDDRYYRLVLKKQTGLQLYSKLLQGSQAIELQTKLYPQPAKEEAFIFSPALSTPLRLFNLMGQELPLSYELIEEGTKGNRYRLNLQSLAAGQYILQTAYGAQPLIKQ